MSKYGQSWRATQKKPIVLSVKWLIVSVDIFMVGKKNGYYRTLTAVAFVRHWKSWSKSDQRWDCDQMWWNRRKSKSNVIQSITNLVLNCIFTAFCISSNVILLPWLFLRYKTFQESKFNTSSDFVIDRYRFLYIWRISILKANKL